MKSPNSSGILRSLIFAIGVVAFGAGVVAAQTQPTSTVAGLVFDSTAMQPLTGARVAVMGTSSVTTTD